MKKLIALILAAVMCLSLLPVMAMADTGSVIADGDKVVIYAPAYNKALSTTKTGFYNVGVDVTVTNGVVSGYGDTEVFDVIDNGDGTYSFAHDGQNLGLGDSYSSMNLGEKHDKWVLEALDNGKYLVKNTGRGNYLEWYSSKNNWSSYSNAADDQFHMSFYVVPSGEETHTHEYVAGNPQKKDHREHITYSTCACEATTSESELHTYDANGYCSVCKYQYAPKATVTVAQAIEIASGFAHNQYSTDMYAITGVVSKIDNEQYGNLYIKDAAGDEILIYGLWAPYNGVRYDELEVKPAVGDTVTVHTVLGAFYETPQGKNGWLMKVGDDTGHVHDYVAGQTTVKNHRYHTVSYTCACGDSKTEDALHTYSATGYCSVCKYQYAPKATVSITEAIAIAGTDGNYTTDLYAITGVVTSITDTQFGNLYIKDAAGKELYIYGLFMPYNGDRFDKMTTQPKVGDTITVHAVLGSYNGVPQAKNAWLMEIKAPEAPETTKPTEAPQATQAPQGTQAPEATQAPQTTQAPEGNDPTEAPKPTEGNKPTEAPKPTESKPEESKPAEGTDEAGKIVDTAYELEVGAKLPYESTLTGKITKIDTVYSEQYKNITVTIAIKGREDKPIMCFRLKGEQAAGLAVGDTITVTGTLMNYNGTIEFDAGCKLGEVIKNNVPPTGDSTIIAPVALLMALSCTGLAVLTLGKKKFF